MKKFFSIIFLVFTILGLNITILNVNFQTNLNSKEEEINIFTQTDDFGNGEIYWLIEKEEGWPINPNQISARFYCARAMGYTSPDPNYQSIIGDAFPNQYEHGSYYRAFDNSQAEARFGEIYGGYDYSDLDYTDNDGIGRFTVNEYRGEEVANMYKHGPAIDLIGLAKFNGDDREYKKLFEFKLPNYVDYIYDYYVSFAYFDQYYGTAYNDDTYEYRVHEANFDLMGGYIAHAIWGEGYENGVYPDNKFIWNHTSGVNEATNPNFWFEYDEEKNTISWWTDWDGVPTSNTSNGNNYINYKDPGVIDSLKNNDDLVSIENVYINANFVFNDIVLESKNKPEIKTIENNGMVQAQIIYDSIETNGRENTAKHQYDDYPIIAVQIEDGEFTNIYETEIVFDSLIIGGLEPDQDYEFMLMQYKNPMYLDNPIIETGITTYDWKTEIFFERIPNSEIISFHTTSIDTSRGISNVEFNVDLIDQNQATFNIKSDTGITFKVGDKIRITDETQSIYEEITFKNKKDHSLVATTENIEWNYIDEYNQQIVLKNLSPNTKYDITIEIVSNHYLRDDYASWTYKFTTDFESFDSDEVYARTLETTNSSISGIYNVDLKGRPLDSYWDLKVIDQTDDRVLDAETNLEIIENEPTNNYNYEFTNLMSNYQLKKMVFVYPQNIDGTILNDKDELTIVFDENSYTDFEKPKLNYETIDLKKTDTSREIYFEIEDYGSFESTMRNDEQNTILTKYDLINNMKFEIFNSSTMQWEEINQNLIIEESYIENSNKYYVAFSNEVFASTAIEDGEEIRFFLPYYDRLNDKFEYSYTPDYIFDFGQIANLNDEETQYFYQESNDALWIKLNGNLHGGVGSEDFFFTYEVNHGEELKTDYRTSSNMIVESNYNDSDNTIDYIYKIYNVPNGKTIDLEDYGFERINYSYSWKFDETNNKNEFYTDYLGPVVNPENVKLTAVTSRTISFKVVIPNSNLNDFNGTQLKIYNNNKELNPDNNDNVNFEIYQDGQTTIFYYTVSNLKPGEKYGDVYVSFATSYSEVGFVYSSEAILIGEIGTSSFEIAGMSWQVFIAIITLLIIFVVIIFMIYLNSKLKKNKQIFNEINKIEQE